MPIRNLGKDIALFQVEEYVNIQLWLNDYPGIFLPFSWRLSGQFLEVSLPSMYYQCTRHNYFSKWGFSIIPLFPLFSQQLVELVRLFSKISITYVKKCHVELNIDNFFTDSFLTNVYEMFLFNYYHQVSVFISYSSRCPSKGSYLWPWVVQVDLSTCWEQVLNLWNCRPTTWINVTYLATSTSGPSETQCAES